MKTGFAERSRSGTISIPDHDLETHPMHAVRLTITADEQLRLVQVMGDIQAAVAAYYAETAARGDFGRHVRNWLSSVQTLNDLLTKELGDKTTYTSLFGTSPTPGAELINAVKYARNADQHVMQIVAPPKSNSLIGGLHGFRIFALWEPIPQAVHDNLQPRTQKLQPAYIANLQGKEVTGTMLAVLRFFADVAPQIVHRDQRGEWTGFPLKAQPGVLDALHPDEPVRDIAAAHAWLKGRRPNGDARVVVGQVTYDGTPYLVGFTFADQLAFSPFVEASDQVERDVAAGFPYLVGDLSANVTQVEEKFPSNQGGVLHSAEDVTTWATPITQTRWSTDWLTVNSLDWWQHLVTLQHPGAFPDSGVYEQHRNLRLNAHVPPAR